MSKRELPKFSGPSAHCQKCGSRGARTIWQGPRETEYMLRVCQTCGYSWKEQPLHDEEKRNA